MNTQKQEPDWAHRSNHISYKPNWQDKIPHELYELGRVFFPIPHGVKGWNWPHHMDEYRFEADDETLNAYFDSGYGYGIACSGDTAVVDIDERSYVDEFSKKIPETLRQVTGSREGVHFFLKVPNLDSRIILHYPSVSHDCDNEKHECWIDRSGNCVKEYEWEHLGEVKCDSHGYVIGPGSVHPSGNRYGPLKGNSIAKMSKEELEELVGPFIKPERPPTYSYNETHYDTNVPVNSRYSFYTLDADDVLPWLEPEKRIAHPVHGSESGSNFMKNKDGETFTCWRHNHGGTQGCAVNAQQLLAIEETGVDCDRVRDKWEKDPILHWRAWKKAIEERLITADEVPYKVVLGYGLEMCFIDDEEQLKGQTYWNVVNAVRYDVCVRGAVYTRPK